MATAIVRDSSYLCVLGRWMLAALTDSKESVITTIRHRSSPILWHSPWAGRLGNRHPPFAPRLAVGRPAGLVEALVAPEDGGTAWFHTTMLHPPSLVSDTRTQHIHA